MSLLQRNWVLKIASLLVACLLWFYVRSEEAITRREFTVPLEIPVPAGQVLVEPAVVPLVRVSVEGPAGELERLERSAIKPAVHMEGYRTGQTQRLRVEVQPPMGVASDQVTVTCLPAWVPIRTEARIGRRVQLVIEAETALPEGWDWAQPPKAETDQVTVSGLQPVVQRVTRVEAQLRSLAPQEQEQKVPVQLRAVDRDGLEISDNLTLEPAQVLVSVRLARTVWSKRVYVQPIFTIPAGGRPQVTVDPRRVTVYGTRAALQELHFLETPEIDVPPGQARYVQEVRLEPAQGISRVEPATVRVTIEQSGSGG